MDRARVVSVNKTDSLLTIALALALAACDVVGVRGSGNAISEARPVNAFHAVSLSGSGQLVIDHGEAESLTITADDNLLPFLTSEVKNGVLELGIKSRTRIHSASPILYSVTVRNLDSIAVSGSGSVEVQEVHTDRLSIDITGSGSVLASGSADRQEIGISGSGTYEGGHLQSKSSTVRISGSGGAVLAASESLDASISGSGSVRYTGDPVMTTSISGSGSVRKK
jgi:hypothetical protein